MKMGKCGKKRRTRSSPLLGSRLVGTTNHKAEVNLQNVGNPNQSFQTRVAVFRLEKADHRLGKPGPLGQRRHGNALPFTFLPQDASDVTQNLIHKGGQHARTDTKNIR